MEAANRGKTGREGGGKGDVGKIGEGRLVKKFEDRGGGEASRGGVRGRAGGIVSVGHGNVLGQDGAGQKERWQFQNCHAIRIHILDQMFQRTTPPTPPAPTRSCAPESRATPPHKAPAGLS